jgi:phosphoribosyl-dephospho-CoA transferase
VGAALAQPLQRHQLAWLHPAAWAGVHAQLRTADAQAQACAAQWAVQRWPLVVTQQPAQRGVGSDPPATLALGLPAPLLWGRRRLALQVPLAAVRCWGAFPEAATVAPLLAEEARPPWARLCAALGGLGVAARVHGSHGWQWLTGAAYLHAGSDIDLCLPVADEARADAVVALLQSHASALPRRLDGELLLPDGRAYAWREWPAWRSGQARAILCKTLQGAQLQWQPAGSTHHASVTA